MIVSASVPEELPAVLSLLRGARTGVGDMTLAEGELRIPFEYMDSDHAHVYRSSLPGVAPGSVPLMRAYLDISNVTSHDGAIPTDASAGRLDVAFDPSASQWTLQIHGQPAFSVCVSAFAASVTVTDEQVGKQWLRMRM